MNCTLLPLNKIYCPPLHLPQISLYNSLHLSLSHAFPLFLSPCVCVCLSLSLSTALYYKCFCSSLSVSLSFSHFRSLSLCRSLSLSRSQFNFNSSSSLSVPRSVSDDISSSERVTDQKPPLNTQTLQRVCCPRR